MISFAQVWTGMSEGRRLPLPSPFLSFIVDIDPEAWKTISLVEPLKPGIGDLGYTYIPMEVYKGPFCKRMVVF